MVNQWLFLQSHALSLLVMIESIQDAVELTEALLSSDEREAISASRGVERGRDDSVAISYCCRVCWNIILEESLARHCRTLSKFTYCWYEDIAFSGCVRSNCLANVS